MSGEIDLSVLLASMAAELVPGRFVFGTAVDPQLARDVEAVATVGETEGLSLVTTQQQADRVGLTYDFVAGWITLRVHPALEAVGLTAAVSTALASAGISCNVIAGYHHDHLLVPIEKADRALLVLQELAARAKSDQYR